MGRPPPARKLSAVRAVVVQPDRSLVVEQVDEPEPQEGEVRIRVEACGICGSDLHMRPAEGALPAGSILGHEFAGTIDAVGAGAGDWAVGDRVCVYPGEPLDHHDMAALLVSGIGLGARPGGYAEAVVCDSKSPLAPPGRARARARGVG